MKRVFTLLASALLVAAVLPASVGAIVAGAGFTTFDATQGGCKDSPNGIDCNNYASKDDVYMSGGPNAAGLSDGDYFFAVLVPGFQNGGFTDGADGNLSDTTSGATAGDAGSGDAVADRTFSVSNHQITSYAGSHNTGTSPNGRAIIQLSPYDDTSNAGGVYILAICQVGATSPSQCKYDAFRIEPGTPVTPFGVVSGMKYYDANTNGQWDLGEPGIAGWPIDFTDGVSGTLTTDSSGAFSASFVADTYTFSEQVAGSPWMQTGNLVDQSSTSGGATVTLNADKSYTVVVVDGSTASGLNFGNVCLGAGGGHTLGFWSNKNGQAIMKNGDNFGAALAFLSGLNLRKADGSNFDPSSYTDFRTWLLNASATNMAYMLSAQLAAMELNVRYGFVSGSALIYAPGTTSANVNGFATVNAVMAEANTELGLHGLTLSGSPYRSYQEALKNALDNANNNLTFVQPGPGSCPTPDFPQ
jgi:hypothetical protein